MSEFKVGDKVVLRPETKPYTYTESIENVEERGDILNEDSIHEVNEIDKDGNVWIEYSDTGFVAALRPHHLKHAVGNTNLGTLSVDAEEEFNEHLYELRLDIFKTNPSLPVDQMQEIENWLLNK